MKARKFLPTLVLASILLAFFALGLALSIGVPLGESSDESAHFGYIKFIADNGRLPQTMAERESVGYRSKWPPLYHALVAPIVHFTENDGIQSLREINAGSTRLLPFDGFSEMSILHTDDETFPFGGIVRAWHAARTVSVLLGVGTLWLAFLVFRQYFSIKISLAATAIAATIPQFIRIDSALNDDALLAFLAVLYLWILLPMFKNDGTWRRYLALGIVSGALLTAKYSTLLLPLSLVWFWVLRKEFPNIKKIIAWVAGYGLAISWWFGFVWRYFNEVSNLGWLKGSLAPFVAGGTDSTTRQIGTLLGVDSIGVGAFNLPVSAWFDWLKQMLLTMWLPLNGVAFWAWGPMLILALIAIWGGVMVFRQNEKWRTLILLLGGYILLFVPLPIVRFFFTKSIPETAQGRHVLFPALLPLVFLLILGLRYWLNEKKLLRLLGVIAVFQFLILTVVVWPKITFADTPYFPVKSTLDEAPQFSLDVNLAQDIELLGVSPASKTRANVLPVTLFWRAGGNPAIDYSYRLEISDAAQNPVGVWQGQPVNGRYPTRAWEAGDVIYDTVNIPILPKTKAGKYSLRLQFLDDLSAPVLVEEFAIDASSTAFDGAILAPRGGRLPSTAPYRLRNTIAVILDEPLVGVILESPQGEKYSPVTTLSNEHGTLLLFAVDWRWVSGDYQLISAGGEKLLSDGVVIQNNYRRTDAPPISRPLNANFDDKFMLLGYDLSDERVRAGEHFDVTLYWKNLQNVNMGYQVFNHLLSADGVQFGGQDRVPQEFYSTILWQPGEVVIDSYAVPVFQNAPNGIYWLDVGLYPSNNIAAASLPLASANGNSVRWGPVRVGGQPEISLPTDSPDNITEFQFGDSIVLRGYSMANNAGMLHLNLYWDAIASPTVDEKLFIHIIDSAGEVVAQADAPPVQGLYPTSFWDAGEMISDSREISLSDLPAGSYKIRLGWYDPVSGQRLPVDGDENDYIDLSLFSVR